jgi:hypothetical protein
MSSILDKILNEICLDDRISNGTPDLRDPNHISVLREYMIKIGFPEQVAIEATNKLMEKGQHPERQAYNKNGILVTFPSPDHKQKAVSAGTHFEKDPTKAPPNVTFDQSSTGQAQPDQSATPAAAPTTPDQSPAPDAAPAQPAAPAPAPVSAPVQSTPSPEKIDTPQEKMATADVIKQILRSDDSVMEETVRFLEKNMPPSLTPFFHK